MQNDLKEWASKYVPKFNEKAEEIECANGKTIGPGCFYTQSDLNKVEGAVETMIIGINPYGEPISEKPTILTAEEYLKGNSDWWPKRFSEPSNFIKGGRWFMGYNALKTEEWIDDDSKTVWTNLTPFQSKKGLKDLPKERLAIGVESTIALIKILKPKRIILFGVEAFSILERTEIKEAESVSIDNIPLFGKNGIKIGEIDNIPTICVNHPSQKWIVSNSFISIIIFLHKLYCVDNKGRKRGLTELRNVIHRELKAIKENFDF